MDSSHRLKYSKLNKQTVRQCIHIGILNIVALFMHLIIRNAFLAHVCNIIINIMLTHISFRMPIGESSKKKYYCQIISLFCWHGFVDIKYLNNYSPMIRPYQLFILRFLTSDLSMGAKGFKISWTEFDKGKILVYLINVDFLNIWCFSIWACAILLCFILLMTLLFANSI